MFDADLAFQARLRPRALALVTPGRQATYGQFDADVNRFAAGLRDLGVGPARGIVAIEAASNHHHHVLLVALARLGVATTSLDDTAADLVISQAPGEAGERMLRLSAEWTARVEAAEPVVVPSAPRDPDALARIMLSSGTTRLARRVPLTWGRLQANALNGVVAYGAGRLGAWVIRTSVDSGQGYMLATLAWSTGAAVVTDFTTPDLPTLFERLRPSLCGLTPIQLRELLEILPPGFEPLPGLRLLVTGGLLAPAVALDARMRLTPDVMIVYGATESGRSTVGPAALVETHPGAVGYPVPGVEIEFVDPNGRPVAEGELGEVRIKSDRGAQGYLGDPEASAAAFRDGFFYPGDLGRRLPDGGLVIEGRIDDRMNIGGIKLLPNVVEDAAMDHPGVRDAAAFALPDAAGQDQCWLAVVLADGVTRESLVAHLERSGDRLPTLRFAWAEAIPRNAMGKIERAALREQVLAALGGAANAG